MDINTCFHNSTILSGFKSIPGAEIQQGYFSCHNFELFLVALFTEFCFRVRVCMNTAELEVATCCVKCTSHNIHQV